MDVISLFNDFSVDYKTEGHKHCTPGWVNTPCPFCTGNPGYHLGYNLTENYFYCWRCGWHPTEETISQLINQPISVVKTLLRQYGARPQKPLPIKHRSQKPHQLPQPIGPLEMQHKKYLENRGFDPDKLEDQWKLMGTGPVSVLDGINYKHRILAPIYWELQQVSFQTRDITGKATRKYLTCPKDREYIHHKHILYGYQTAWSDTGICVEGITDVWRLGVKSFATFGIEFTHQQVRLMAHLFKRVIVLFDSDPQAQKQADKLVAELRFRGIKANKFTSLEDKSDPASLPQDDANHLVRTILRVYNQQIH